MSWMDDHAWVVRVVRWWYQAVGRVESVRDDDEDDDVWQSNKMYAYKQTNYTL